MRRERIACPQAEGLLSEMRGWPNLRIRVNLHLLLCIGPKRNPAPFLPRIAPWSTQFHKSQAHRRQGQRELVIANWLHLRRTNL